MSRQINYMKFKKKKIDICNICGSMTELSWDHVPPKGAIMYSDVKISSLYHRFSLDEYPEKISQNGTKYRTICSKCNSMLGKKYDSRFVIFIKESIDKIVKLDEKKMSEVEINPARLIKSLFGHLLAAQLEYPNSKIDKKMRNYLLKDMYDDNNLNIYCWFYPFANNQVIREMTITKIQENRTYIFSCLKLYPLAFIVTGKKFDFLTRIPFLDTDIEVDIPIDYEKVIHPDWPAIVDDNTIIFGSKSSEQSSVAIPRGKR